MSAPGDALTTDDAPPTVVAPAFAPGTLIADRYRIEARLGAGGGGTVWRCFDTKLETVVALKILSTDGDLERWRREVAMARRIAHRNVCRVHDLGEAGELRFVTMELVEGESLRSRVRADLAAPEARSLFEQIVAGTAAIHEAGVVHRDLKPENVVVAPDGRAVIVDFGLAREPRPVDSTEPHAVPASRDAVTAVLRGPAPMPERIPSATVTNAGTVVGTPRYMSPEQAAGETVDARTDVWALGLIGHELVTGTFPDADEHGRRVDPAVDAKLPRGVSILRRCLALLPEERYADARALQAALRARVRRRWPLVVAGGAALVAIAATVAIVVATRSGQRTHRPDPGPLRMVQLTRTVEWPEQMPHSLALSPDGKRFAYSTAAPKLYVRPLEGGAVEWPIPEHVKPATRLDGKPLQQDLVMVYVAGWFADGSLAIQGTTSDGRHHLFRIYQDGRSQLLRSSAQRMSIAVDPVHGRVAIGTNGQALDLLGPGGASDLVTTIGAGEQVMALAWSPDGARLAVARVPSQVGEEALLQIVDARGQQVREIWRGHTSDVIDPFLAWLDDERVAFTVQDPGSRETALLAIEVATGDVVVRDTWQHEHLGLGSAANGVVLLLRGSADDSVQVRDKLGFDSVRAHARDTQASRIAGWTSAGELVFVEGAPGAGRLVTGLPGRAATPWPATQPGVELPDTVIDSDVIAHLVDPADAGHVLIVRLSPDGSRRQLARVANHGIVNPVRCAGDRGPPCMIEQISEDDTVTWSDFDPETGAIGRTIHRRRVRERFMRGWAISHDGGLLAIVDGGHEITVLDRATGEPRAKSPAADAGAALQSVSFDPEGDLWATSIGHDGRLFGLMRFGKRPDGSHGYPSRMTMKKDAMRWFWRPTLRGTGSTLEVAVTVRELRLDVWRVENL